MNERVLKALYKIAEAASVDNINKNLEMKKELGVGSAQQKQPPKPVSTPMAQPAAPQEVQSNNDARIRRITPQMWDALPKATRDRYVQRNVLPPHLARG